MLNITPIQLLAGSYEETATTGQGCFMNVVAYLNGEAQITDKSPCVCSILRPMIIELNDSSSDAQRQQLIPFIQRAMGSTTTDPAELSRRRQLRRAYLLSPRKYVEYLSECCVTRAHYDDETFARGLQFLDAVLPPAEAPASPVLARAATLVQLYKEHA